MQTSFLDILPPEAQAQLGVIAAVTALVGLILWSAGIKIARAAVAVLFGGAGAALAAWLVPEPTGLAPFTCGITGLVAGLMLGVLAFRVLQGLALALCLALAVAGVYDRWHLHAPAFAYGPAATLVSTAPATARHAAALVERTSQPTSRPGLTISAAALVETVRDHFVDRWVSIPSAHQKVMVMLSLATALAALLVAFAAPRQTTWIVTALLGSLLLLAGVFGLIHVYAPQDEWLFSANALPRYSTLAAVTLVGMLIQHLVFWPKKAASARSTKPIPNVMPPNPPAP